MSRQYQYIKINDRYYCLQQNPAVLAWILFLQKSSLDLISRSYPRKISNKNFFWVQRKWCAFRSNFLVYLAIMRYKYFQKISKSALTLPIYGQICKAAHQGYKIFDFRRRVVAKVFDQNVDRDSVLKEIDKVKIVSQMDFAPSLRRWNVEEHWYEEEYIEGHLDVDHSYKPVDDSVTVLEKFRHIISPCIANLMLFKSPMMVDLTKYINDISGIMDGSRLFRQEFGKVDKKEINEIKKFFRLIIEQLTTGRNCSLYLVFTHGDFCSANILNTKDRIKIIDWEHATYRSALFDFYSYFFYRPYRNKISVHDLVPEVNKALSYLISQLSLKSRELSKSISSLERTYRLLYYIERIGMLVEREMTDTNLNIMGTITKYIDVFSSYEEILMREYRGAQM